MSFELVKAVRVRPTYPTIDERLGIYSMSDFKGAFGDIRVELLNDRSLLGKKWRVTWFPIADGNGGSEINWDKSDIKLIHPLFDQYSFTDQSDTVIFETMKRKARSKISASGTKDIEPENYYSIVQDPWLDNPPLIRNFGYDPYYLNNGAKVSILWMIKDKFSLLSGQLKNTGDWIGGTVWSDDKGEEKKGEPIKDDNGNILEGAWFGRIEGGVWVNPNHPFTSSDIGVQYVDGHVIELYNVEEVKKYILIEELDGSERFTNADENIISDFIKTTGDVMKINEWGKSIKFWSATDLDLISSIIEVWKKKVPNYDLKICEPSYFPTITLDYISPLQPPPGITPSTDNITPTTDIVGDKKFKISIVYDKNNKIKAKEDFNGLNIYIGEPPVEGEFQFTDDFDDLSLLDDQYFEVGFKGLEEVLSELSEKYTPPNNTEDEVYQGIDSDRGSDGTGVTYIEGISTGAGANNENGKVKVALKRATDATGGGESGKCARFTFNHANNFVKSLINKSLKKGATIPAGGNANQAGYHNALVKLGYVKKDTVKVTKSELKRILETSSNWDLGDVVAYWGISSALSDKGGVKYGHTQIFTNGVHGSSNKWTSDNFGNFNCAFVYNKYNVDTWKLVILKSPTAGKKIA